MANNIDKNNKRVIFEDYPVGKALAVMAFPTIMSQLITLVYNMTDTWFIGRTDNPYMDGMVWSQVIADSLNVAFSYLVYFMVRRKLGLS